MCVFVCAMLACVANAQIPSRKSNQIVQQAGKRRRATTLEKRRQPKICIQHKRDAVADAAGAGEVDGAVAVAVAV